MKRIKEYIIEKLKISKDIKLQEYHYYPKSKIELRNLIEKLIKERGKTADLNDIDVSNITDMNSLFYGLKSFNGDISEWDVSNVKDMSLMFYASKFNGDISKWDVSNVTDMGSMFYASKFTGDISKWDVNNVKNMKNIFGKCALEKNPPSWHKEN